MPEIERKFLLSDDPPAGGPAGETIEQGYLAIDRDGTEVRIRRRRGACTLTVKSGAAGVSRAEEEMELDPERFERLWPLTEGRRVEKERRVIALPGRLAAEVDVYTGALAGLRVVEVEFASESDAERFHAPAWFGVEITDDRRYRNRVLAVEGPPRD